MIGKGGGKVWRREGRAGEAEEAVRTGGGFIAQGGRNGQGREQGGQVTGSRGKAGGRLARVGAVAVDGFSRDSPVSPPIDGRERR